MPTFCSVSPLKPETPSSLASTVTLTGVPEGVFAAALSGSESTFLMIERASSLLPLTVT